MPSPYLQNLTHLKTTVIITTKTAITTSRISATRTRAHKNQQQTHYRDPWQEPCDGALVARIVAFVVAFVGGAYVITCGDACALSAWRLMLLPNGPNKQPFQQNKEK
jgi:hypothetical protein